MNNAAGQIAIRRIAVALDASGFSRAALETAICLAAALSAELEGIFVEDTNLMRLTGLPFLREIRPWSLAEEALSGQRMQRELRALARQAEQALVQAVGETGISWSFRVWRGRAETESLIASFDADVLSLARSGLGTSVLMQPGFGSGTRPARYPAPAIAVLFSGSEQAVRALAAACHLATALNGLIKVLLPKIGGEDIANLRGKAEAVVAAYTQRATYVELSDLSVHTLARVVKSSRSTALITAAADPLLQDRALSQCLGAISCPLLLVR